MRRVSSVSAACAVALVAVMSGCTLSASPVTRDQATPTAGRSADALCADAPPGELPSQSEIAELDIDWVVACRWRNPDMYGTRTKGGPAGAVFLSEAQQAELATTFHDAEPSRPDCILIDSPPAVSFIVLMRDTTGHMWRVVVPNTRCMRFSMGGRSLD